MMRAVGEMPEWPNGTDSKSVVPSPVPRVRIPISPPFVGNPCKSTSYRGRKKEFLDQFSGLFLSRKRTQKLFFLPKFFHTQPLPCPLVGTTSPLSPLVPTGALCPQNPQPYTTRQQLLVMLRIGRAFESFCERF